MLRIALFIYGLVCQVALVSPFLIVGLVIESVARRRTAPSVKLNLVATLIFLASETAVSLSLTLAAVRGVGLMPGHGALHALVGHGPVVLEAFVWLLCADLAYYWYHRAQHTFPWLWAVHELHHADEHMNVTTARRHHWLETLALPLCVVVPIAYLLEPSPALGLSVALFSNLLVFTSHLDVRVSLGRWNWLVVTPESHRLHHSIALAHRDKNFAMLCPIWDVAFGTYFAPTGEAVRTGVEGVQIDTVSDLISLRRKSE